MGGLHLSRKADAGLVVILIVIIILLFFGWLVNVGQRECRTNRDCSSEAYCGSDFACHPYPNIQKTVVQYNLFWSAVIIGIAIIIAAIIFKWDKLRAKEQKSEEIAEHYKSHNSKTP